MTTTLVTMPQLGETVTEGTIVRWYKQPGDGVAVDETLFDVSTDKVDAEVPSAVEGVLREIHVGDGEVAPVGTLLGLITTTADEPVAFDEPEPEPGAGTRPGPEPDVSPRDDQRRAPVRTASVAGERAVLSPVVRSLLSEHDLDAASVAGSGRDGRITRADVLAAATARDAAPAAPLVAPEPRPAQGPNDEVLPFTAVRRATADNLARSVVTAAHALVVMEVDYTNVDASRRHTGLTYLPYVSRAVVDGIAAFPHVNASVGADHLLVHHDVNLGFAVDIAREALLVPVLHEAASLRLRQLGSAVADLAERRPARAPAGRRARRCHVHRHRRRFLRHRVDRPHHQPTPGRDRGGRRREDAAHRGPAARRRLGHGGAPARQPLAELRPPCLRRCLRGGLPGPRP